MELQAVNKSKFKLDPRTKILLLVTITMFVSLVSRGNLVEIIKIILVGCPFVGLISIKRIKGATLYLALYILSTAASKLWLPYIHGPLNAVMVIVCVVFSRMTPGFAMGWYFLYSTTVSEFMAALEKMHVTQKISIPLAVIFRFIPTIKEEYTSINDAMKMRGISLGGSKKSKILEYRVVPLMICSVKIGEELSAAALTRGLGADIERTNICEIGFSILDIFFIILCIISLGILILG